MNRIFSIVCILSIILIACDDNSIPKEISKENAPFVVTGEATEISYYSALLSGSVTFSSNAGPVRVGMICSKDANPNFNNGVTLYASKLDSDGAFNVRITDLNHSTIYYYRAVVQQGDDLYYGGINSFCTYIWGTLSFTVPPYKEYVKKFIFESGLCEASFLIDNYQSVCGLVESIDNTAEGRSIIVLRSLDDNCASGEDIFTAISSYEYSEGAWIIDGLGEIRIKDEGTVVFTDKDNELHEVSATIVEPLTGTVADNLCRLWRIYSTTVDLKCNKPGVADVRRYFYYPDSSNLQTIASYIARNCGIDAGALKGAEVKTIEVTDGGSFVIDFVEDYREPPVFNADIRLEDDSFYYNLLTGHSNIIFDSNARVMVSFDGIENSPKCRIAFDEVNVDGVNSYSVEFLLVGAR